MNIKTIRRLVEDIFTFLSNLLSKLFRHPDHHRRSVEAQVQVQTFLHSMDGFITTAPKRTKIFTDRHGLTWVPGKYYEIMPMRLGLKFTRHDHIPESS